MSFRVVIPARYASTRLPGKVLCEIAGRPVLAHVVDRAGEAGADAVWVATDDERVRDGLKDVAASVAMTSGEHTSGTDRIAEVAASQGWSDGDIVVNLQGDEPLMPGALIAQVADTLMHDPSADVATACTPVESLAEYRNPNAVKVVCADDGGALYFSRAPIPHHRDGGGLPPAGAFRHLGIYAYRVSALRRFTGLPPHPLERSESLEQLRALAAGMRIAVTEAGALPGPGVDTAEDLARVAELLKEAR